MRRVRPEAIGNPLMIYLADQLLERDGLMFEAFLLVRCEQAGKDIRTVLEALAIPPSGRGSRTARFVGERLAR